MVTMAARWAGRCRGCGRAILPGMQMDWEKGHGARHLNEAECALAPAEAPKQNVVLRGPQPELPEERARIEQLLLSHSWKAATSKVYEKLPHEYSLQRLWLNDEDFAWCVEYIRRVGYETRFIGRVWTYYDVGEYQYWTMGSPVPETTLINRAVRRPASARSGS